MTPALHAHIKHIIIVVLLVAGAVGALEIRGKYEQAIADRQAKRDEVIAANQAKVADAQKTIQSAQQANTAIDSETKAKLASLQQQLAAKPDSAQIKAIVEASLPGVRASNGVDESGRPILSILDTQANRDAINKAQIDYKTCQFNLSDCQAKQANFQTIIAAKDEQLSADKSTMELQAKDIKEMRKNQVPRHTLMIGIGKAQGANFQDVNSYQPVIGYDFRLTNRFGIFGIAQNKQAAAGISWHFGGIR